MSPNETHISFERKAPRSHPTDDLYASSADANARYPDDMAGNVVLSSTYPGAAAAFLEKRLLILCRQAQKESLEPGMESRFSGALRRLVAEYHHLAIDSLARLIMERKVDGKAALYALAWLGDLDDPCTYESRFLTLRDCLDCRHSVWVRDGAIQGMSLLEDPRAVSAIRHRMKSEPDRWLREDMEKVVSELENTSSCLSS